MHQNYLVYRGFKNPVQIAEADSNSHTAFVHTLTIGPDKKVKHIESLLHFIDSSIPDDPVVAARAHYWTKLGYAGFEAAGFSPKKVVTILPTPLVALARIIENRHNELTQLVTEAMLLRYPHVEISFVNAGAMRLDDVIPAGPITQYDILRLCPYDNSVWLARLPGYLLIQALSIGTTTNRDLGAFIHYQGVELVNGVWQLISTQEPIDSSASYKVVSTDFLLGGNERNLGFLAPTSPGVTQLKKTVDNTTDLRQLIMQQLKKLYGSPQNPTH
jgi:5'-nucleotidase